MRLVALIGGIMTCTEWFYKGYDAMVRRRESKGRRVSAGDGLLNGELEKER